MNCRLIFLSVLLTLAALGALLSRLTLAGSQTSARDLAITTIQGYKVEHVTSPGVNTSVITTPNGQIMVNVPSDLYAGDTFTGTMQTDPAGKGEAERAQNLVQLNAMVLVIGQQPTSVSEKTFTRTISPGSANYSLSLQGQEWVDTTLILVRTSPPPQPNKVQLPTGGQIGHNVVVPAPCNGIFDRNDSAKIGGTELKPLAESPRMKVFQNDSQVSGLTQIEFTEQGVVSRGPFQNIGVRLSGNTNLLRGQQGPLNLVIFGLQHLQQVVPVDLQNSSSNVVGVSGGDVQHFEILPTAVSSNGEWSKTFTMTGRSVGAFNITATVRWKNPCQPGQADCEGPLQQCGAGGHPCGEGLKYWCTSDDQPCQPVTPCGAAHPCGEGLKYWCTRDDKPCQPPSCAQGAHPCGEGLKYWCTGDDKPCQPPLPPTGPRGPTNPPNTPTGPRPPVPSVPLPSPEPSPRYPRPSPSPPPERTCVPTKDFQPGPGIEGNAYAPLGDPISKLNESIPLFVTASDIDQVIQTCSCPPGSQSKKIDIVDSVHYEWTLSGKGKLDVGGTASLYTPPPIPVGGKISEAVEVEITDSGNNGVDHAKHVKFTITIEHLEECSYKRDVKIENDFGGGEPAEAPPGENECKPIQESWLPGEPIKAEADDNVRVCVGEQIVLNAKGSDTDTLTLKCDSANCGKPTKVVHPVDEIKYTWKALPKNGASSGGFLDGGGGTTITTRTYGQNTSVIYKAPEKAGDYTVTVDIENKGGPAPDPKVSKTIHVKVYKLDLEVEGMEGASREEKECPGATISLNNLTKIVLKKEPAEGTMTLNVSSGRDRIEIWEDKERKKKAESLTFPATEGKELWIEGVRASKSAGDVELVLESGGVPCKDKVKLTVAKQLCHVKLVLESVKYLNGPLIDNADNIGENWKFKIKVDDQKPVEIPEHKLAYGDTNFYKDLVYDGTPLDKAHDNRFVECSARDAHSYFFFTITATEIARFLGADSAGSANGQVDFEYDCTKEQAESTEFEKLNQLSTKSRRKQLRVWIRERSIKPGQEFSGKIAQLEFTFRLDAECAQK